MNRKEQMQRLRDNRLTYEQIGEIFGISRQRVHQILNNDRKSHILKLVEQAKLNKLKLEEKKKNLKNININDNISRITGIKAGSRERNRELIRIRDNHTCQICDKKWKPGQRRFDVHHLDEDNTKSRQVDNLKEEAKNMITLCHKCHLRLHYGLFNLPKNNN